MTHAEFCILLTAIIRRTQAGDAVANVLQDSLEQLRQEWGVQHLALYRNEQMVLSSGETFYPGQLPDTWQVEKRVATSGETWFYPTPPVLPICTGVVL